MWKLQDNSTLILQHNDGTTTTVGARFKNSNLYGFKYVIVDDGSEDIVGMVEHDRHYFLGDRVSVTGDIMGYICPGIRHPGMGYITRVRTDDTDHFYGVQMDNGEFGFMKSARIEVMA